MKKFLKSLARSIGQAVSANPDVERLVGKHERCFGFLRRRLTLEKFSGLPLTVLTVAIAFILYSFVDTLHDLSTANPLVAADTRLENLLYYFRDPRLIAVSLWLTVLGRWQVVAVFTAVAVVLLGLWKRREYVVPMLVTIVGSSVSAEFLKAIVHRPRPDVAYYLENSYSFPSGHAIIAVAFYGFLFYLWLRRAKRWWGKLVVVFLGVVVALAIGFSRLYLGVHYVSDVWGGYLVGALWLTVGIGIMGWFTYRKPETAAPLSGKRKNLALLMLLAGCAYYVNFGLHYNPAPLAEPVNQAVVMVSNAEELFQKTYLPRYTETLTGVRQEPISLLFVAKDDNALIGDMEIAGWTLAGPLNVRSGLELAKTALSNASYPAAPMTPSFWNAQVHDFGFERQTASSTVRSRHHVRIWRTDVETANGERVYVGTASLDTGIKWLITHRIDPNIDAERELVFSTLTKAGVVSGSQEFQSVPAQLGKNFGGDEFFTDGRAHVITLK